MKIVLIGGPGAGKGTQAEVLNEKYNLPIVGTGGIFRKEMKKDTLESREIKKHMDEGTLVSDEITIKLVKNLLKQDKYKDGFILDGFPRTINQAIALQNTNLKPDRVIAIKVDENEIIKRLSGRRICPECNATYHIEYKKPEVDGICEVCGTELIRRDDDEPETIKKRIELYEHDTEPLIKFYEEIGVLRIVYGQEKIEDTTKLTLEAVER